MVAVQRGNNTEITTIDGRPLETDYAGNYADVCPTGSLTLKDFRYKKRAWFLKKTPTVCEGCSKGCNLELHQDANHIHRSIPRENMEINRYWLCDEGRFNFHYVNSPNRVTEPTTRAGVTDWYAAIESAKSVFKGKKPTILVGSDLTQEEAKLLLEFLPKQFPGASIAHFGTNGIKSVADDAPADKILKRKSKTSNLNGLEKLGYKGFDGAISSDGVLIFRGGRAQLPELKNAKVVGVGVFTKQQSASFEAVLPGCTWAEKDGTILNYENREQRIKRSLLPVGQSKQLSEILMMWANTHPEKFSDSRMRTAHSVGGAV
jgi:NADH-quinone oxidoreductase subunit G